MKNVLKIVPVILLTALFHGVASAQTLKIATVDVGKVFTNFYKTKLAQANITDQQNQLVKEENDLVANLKKGDTEYKSLLASASDPALSADERDKNQKAADAKLKELQETKAELDEYDRSAKERITDQIQRVHDKILNEIRDKVAMAAKAGGYTLVLDAGAQSPGGTPTVIFNAGQADLTDAVIKDLNVGAPVDLPTIPSPMMSTNSP